MLVQIRSILPPCLDLCVFSQLLVALFDVNYKMYFFTLCSYFVLVCFQIKINYPQKEVHPIMSIIVQRDATIYSFIIFLQTALHVSDDTFTHHQEHTQTVITTCGTGRTVFATVRWRGGVTMTPPRQQMVANMVWLVPDVVITVWVCSWWWIRVPTKKCRAVCRNIIKLCIVESRWTIIDVDSRCTDPWT